MTPLAARYELEITTSYPERVELLDRQRHQRQVGAMEAPGHRHPLDEASGDLLVANEVTIAFGEEVEEAEQVRVGVDVEDLLEHPARRPRSSRGNHERRRSSDSIST